jgi:ankyrin repeat protein
MYIVGMTALHDACYYGFEDIADLLIRHGANVNCFDKDGQTPLHVRRFFSFNFDPIFLN